MTQPINIEPRNGRIAVGFPIQLKEKFRAAFPGARWNPKIKRWMLPENFISAVEKWAVRVKDEAEAAAVAQEVLRTAKVIEKWLGYVEDHAGRGIVYERGVELLTELGIHDNSELAEQMNAAIKRAKEIQKLRETEENTPDGMRKSRALFPVSDLPQTGSSARWQGQVVIFENTGKHFTISKKHLEYEGEHLQGHEGQEGCYVYFREATAQEVEMHDLLEAALAEE